MRWWLLSNTFYGTWLPGDRRGSVTSVRDARPGEPPAPFRFEHDIPGTAWEDEMPGLRRSVLKRMKGPPIHFDCAMAEILLAQFQETAGFPSHALHAVAIMYNYLHFVVQVTGDPDPHRVLADYKAYGSRVLNRRYGKPTSETWWTTGGSTRKLNDDRALASAIYYVLYKRPNPLLVWSPKNGRLV